MIRSRVLSFVSVLALSAALASPSLADVQTEPQAACLASLAKRGSKVVKTRLKNATSCIKKAAAEKDDGCADTASCIAGDAGGKAAKAIAKLRDADAACAEAPDFGRRPLPLAETSALGEPVGLVDDVLGAGTAIVTKAADAKAAACQAKVVGAASKLMLAMGAAYDACKVAGVANGTITDAALLATACLGAIDADGKGKVAGARKSLDGIVGGICDGIDLATVLPGACATAPAFGSCVETVARCRACRRGAIGDDTGADCDLFDDAVANDSCGGFAGRCDGSPALCDRAFNDVAFATTHNAMSNAEEKWGNPNQRYGMTRQLADGIRSMMLDTYFYGGEVVMCHAVCDLGEPPEQTRRREPLVDGLSRLRVYLEVDPGAVLSIIFESYISEAQAAQAFADAGLSGYLHEQDVSDPWPTLGDLVASGKRLVVFTDDSSAALPWHHYVWDYAWETHYSFASTNDFSCAKNRGTIGAPLFILNHFLTQTWGSAGLALQANRSPLFPDRAAQCQLEGGQIPNFVTVDFHDIGVQRPVVDMLNGLPGCSVP